LKNFKLSKLLYIEKSSVMSNATNNFNILAIKLSALYNYFDNSLKLCSDLYLAKFLKTLQQNCSFHEKLLFTI